MWSGQPLLPPCFGVMWRSRLPGKRALGNPGNQITDSRGRTWHHLKHSQRHLHQNQQECLCIIIIIVIIIIIFEFYWEINIKCVECPIHLPSPAVRVNSKLCCGMESCFTVRRYILFNVILILYNPCSVIVSTLCCSAKEWQYIAILQYALLSDGIQYCNIRNTKCIHGQRQCIAEKYK